jgi:hypothetical protein
MGTNVSRTDGLMARIEVVRWIAESKHPFAIVRDRRLLSLMKTGCSNYRLPLPATVARDVKHVFISIQSLIATKLQVSMLTIHRVPHRYGHTRGFWATSPTVTGTVPDFSNRRVTVPVTAVPQYTAYTLLGSDCATPSLC